MAKHMVKTGEVRFDPFDSDDAAVIASRLPGGSPDETMQFILAADESRRLREAAERVEAARAAAARDVAAGAGAEPAGGPAAGESAAGGPAAAPARRRTRGGHFAPGVTAAFAALDADGEASERADGIFAAPAWEGPEPSPWDEPAAPATAAPASPAPAASAWDVSPTPAASAWDESPEPGTPAWDEPAEPASATPETTSPLDAAALTPRPRGRRFRTDDGEDDIFSAAVAPAAATSASDGFAAGDSAAADLAAADSAPSDEPAVGSDEAVGRSAAMMSVLVIISRITGFFRTWAQSWALGATVMSSCYTVANNLPNQLYELVMGGMLVTAFLPVYMSVKKKAGREGASAYASNLLSLVAILMGALAVLAFIFAGQVVWTQSAGATEAFDTDLAIYFFRFFAITIVLYALSSVISGVLNAERDYLWSTAAPILNNIVTMLSFVGYAVLADSNPQLAILILALGGSISVLVQVVVQIPALLRHGVHLTLRIDIHDPAIRETVSIGVPTLIVTLESFVTVSVMNSSALSVAANGASIIYYSRLWYMLPYSILAIPITTAMFTELADHVARGDMEAYKEGVRSGISKIAFMLVPFAMYLITFAPELVAVLGAGRFSTDDALLTVGYLQALSLALPFYGVNTYLQKVCSSLRKMGPFVWASVIAGVVQVVFCVALTPSLGLPAVALCSMLFFLIADILTFVFLRHELGHIGLGSIALAALRSLVLGLAGSLLGWVILWALESFVAPISGSVVQAVAYCVAGGIPALLVTFGIAVALKLPEASFVTTLLRRSH